MEKSSTATLNPWDYINNYCKGGGLVPLTVNLMIKAMVYRTQDLYHPNVYGARIVIAHQINIISVKPLNF